MESSNRSKRPGERLRRDILVIGSALLIMAATAELSFGNPDYLAAFNAQYGTAVTDKFGCQVCHTRPPALNPYGNDYLYSGHNFSAIEFLDSDGDGSTNIVKINAVTNPGDAAGRQRAVAGTARPTAEGSATPSTSTSLGKPVASPEGSD